jgi:Zn-dependent M28 family amino/carboxypeptidase
MRAGDPGATVTLKVPPPVRRPVRLRNVAGLLRGSDPRLGRTYIIVSAHYDHVGICSSGADRICNGANDDASGVASVIEIASALSKMRERPKRSFLFLTYFGEERGLFGSRYYCRHPLVPLKDTVANVNLEHLGRTDDTQGDRTGRATLTGFEYSDISTTFARAGELTGVRVAKAADGDAYFARSDNQALADAGVPAHTLLVAFDFPDYHRPGDEWRKLDYANLEKVDRMIAAGLLMIAANPEPPKWNESSVQAERYLKAWRERKGS